MITPSRQLKGWNHSSYQGLARFSLAALLLLTSACSTSRPVTRAVATDGPSVCELDESVTSSSGEYQSNIDLATSVALPGETGVDVVMTGRGAIAAVNNAEGGELYWVDPATGDINRQVSLPAAASDLAFNGGDTIAVAVEDRIMRLSVATGEVIDERRLPGVSRVAITADGHLGAIADKIVHLFNPDGSTQFAVEKNYTRVTDLDILSCGEGRSLVYVTSFRNARFTDLNGRRNPVQIAKVEALNFSGEVQWTLFGDDTETIKQNVADTRMYRATVGSDGFLYLAGESAGTATIFRWRGQPMTSEEQVGSTEPFLTRIDRHSRLYNSGAAHLTYYARVHPVTGQLVTSQMSFPRLENTKANAMRVGDIAASRNGTVYFGGAASSFIANRDQLTINGESIGAYGGRDRTWMSVAPDFQTRNFWTVLARGEGRGIVQGVDVGHGYSAALSSVESGTFPVTTGEDTGNVFLSFIAE